MEPVHAEPLGSFVNFTVEDDVGMHYNDENDSEGSETYSMGGDMDGMGFLQPWHEDESTHLEGDDLVFGRRSDGTRTSSFRNHRRCERKRRRGLVGNSRLGGVLCAL